MQVAAPKELYNRPANLFVAGFIGSPEMNLIGGRIENGAFRTEGQSVPLMEPLLRRLKSRPEAAVLGIRPQHLKLVAPESEGLDARLNSVEFMGHEVYLHADLDGAPVTVVATAAEYEALGRATGPIRIAPEAEWIHVFDRDSGENISLA